MAGLQIWENEVSGIHLNRLVYVDIENQEPRMQASCNWFS